MGRVPLFDIFKSFHDEIFALVNDHVGDTAFTLCIDSDACPVLIIPAVGRVRHDGKALFFTFDRGKSGIRVFTGVFLFIRLRGNLLRCQLSCDILLKSDEFCLLQQRVGIFAVLFVQDISASAEFVLPFPAPIADKADIRSETAALCRVVGGNILVRIVDKIDPVAEGFLVGLGHFNLNDLRAVLRFVIVCTVVLFRVEGICAVLFGNSFPQRIDSYIADTIEQGFRFLVEIAGQHFVFKEVPDL